MNKVILSGNLCREIELSKTTTGVPYVANCIAVPRDRKEKDGTYSSDYVNFIAWGLCAEYLEKYAHKGDKAEISGRWQSRVYETNLTKKTTNECVVESIKVFSKKTVNPNDSEFEEPTLNSGREDLPF